MTVYDDDEEMARRNQLVSMDDSISLFVYCRVACIESNRTLGVVRWGRPAGRYRTGEDGTIEQPKI